VTDHTVAQVPPDTAIEDGAPRPREHRTHHRFPVGLKATVVKVVVFTGISVVITSIVLFSLLDIEVHPTAGYYADFSDFSGLQAGDTVRVAGVEVGKVGSVSVDGHVARVSFSLETSQHITTTTRAAIHIANLLGELYLDILPGPSGGAPLRPGGVIPVSQTTPPLDLTAVFDGFQPLFAALSPTEVNQLAGSIIDIFQGEAGATSNIISEVSTITYNLAERQDVINQLLTSSASLLRTVGSHDTDLGSLIANFDTLVRGLAASKIQIGGAVSDVNTLTNLASHYFGESQPQLDQDIQRLATATNSLVANQSHINTFFQGLPSLLNVAAKIQTSGNWAQVYVCDLTVNLLGPTGGPAPPLNISIIPGAFPAHGVYPSNITLPSGAIGDQSEHTAACS
jgi:phospholipid/cholesterol/gamma-HCH transport system substrate-binding protein